MSENKALFETMPVPKALAILAVPSIVSQLITMIYNMADAFFIGQTNDPYKVSAAMLAFILCFIMNALSNLFGVGGGSLISRLLGQGKDSDAKNVCALSFYGAILVGALYSLFCLIFMEPILRLMGASDFSIGYASDYALWVVVIGGIPTTLSLTMAHLLRSEGYSKKASLGLTFGSILNIALDPLFMFVILEPGNEVAGAAIATALSNTCVLVFFIFTFLRMRGRSVLSLDPRHAPAGFKYIGRIFAIGLPSAIGSFLSSAASTVSNKLASGYGDIAVAAMGIVKKIDMIPMNVGFGLCQGMMPLVAYNYAAKNYKRMTSAINYARYSGMVFAVLCIICFELFAKGIINLFIDERQTLELGTAFLRIACIPTPIMICNLQMGYTFQAMGKGRQALLLSTCRQGIINIPLMILMNHFFGLYGLMWTQILSDGLTLIVSIILSRRVYRSLALV